MQGEDVEGGQKGTEKTAGAGINTKGNDEVGNEVAHAWMMGGSVGRKS